MFSEKQDKFMLYRLDNNYSTYLWKCSVVAVFCFVLVLVLFLLLYYVTDAQTANRSL